eukprot:GEMP01040890.1.p1 GENE.GEMP01040890.1~~GEMP01040890.1.p1  ORF type:complete len:171 (+),score=28.12 GEMP01040890.1:61-573(+)
MAARTSDPPLPQNQSSEGSLQRELPRRKTAGSCWLCTRKSVRKSSASSPPSDFNLPENYQSLQRQTHLKAEIAAPVTGKCVQVKIVVPDGGKPGMLMRVPSVCEKTPPTCALVSVKIPEGASPGIILNVETPMCKCSGNAISWFIRKKKSDKDVQTRISRKFSDIGEVSL